MVKRIAPTPPFYTFLNLAICELEEYACLLELLLEEGSIFCTIPVEMHLKSFGNELVHFQRSVISHAPLARLIPLAPSNPTTLAPARCRR
jgi:hypothetical protein